MNSLTAFLIAILAGYSSSIPMRDSPPSPPLRNTTVVNNTLADNGPYPLAAGDTARNTSSTVGGNSTRQQDPPFLSGQDQGAVDEYHDIADQNKENLYEWADRYGLLGDLLQYEKPQQNQSKNVTQTTVTQANGTDTSLPNSSASPSSSTTPAADRATTQAPAGNSTSSSGNNTATTTKKPNSGWCTTVSLAILPLIIVQSL